MSWTLALFLLPLVVFAVVLRRVLRLALQLRDPQRLRELFSDEVRSALVDAGFDPDSVTPEDIQGSPELQRLVASDVRRVIHSLVFGLALPGSGRSADAARLRAAPTLDGLPAPIEPPSGGGLRTALALAVLAAIGLAIALGVFRA